MNSVRTEFCNPGRFFAYADAAGEWQRKHAGINVVSAADAYKAGRALSDTLLDIRDPHTC